MANFREHLILDFNIKVNWWVGSALRWAMWYCGLYNPPYRSAHLPSWPIHPDIKVATMIMRVNTRGAQGAHAPPFLKKSHFLKAIKFHKRSDIGFRGCIFTDVKWEFWRSPGSRDVKAKEEPNSCTLLEPDNSFGSGIHFIKEKWTQILVHSLSHKTAPESGVGGLIRYKFWHLLGCIPGVR